MSVFQLSVELLKKIVRKTRSLFIKGIMSLKFKPYDKPTVVFESFGGRQISDSPYAIYLKLKDRPDINCIWSIEKNQQEYCKNNNIPYAIRRTLKWVIHLQKARIWVINTRLPKWVKKPSYVHYIQTWHGTPLKKLGLDIKEVTMPNTNTEMYHQNFVNETHRWDALLSANNYSTNIFRKAFDYHNKILEVGYPRNDKLINTDKDTVRTIKQRLGIPENKKVVLYAPTYRDNSFVNKGEYLFKMPFSIERLLKKLGKDTILVLRMHYLIVSQLNLDKYDGQVMDFSKYHDISDLYLISDLLITDYSSVFFDFAYLKKPILFFPYDYSEYKDELRGFYLNYEKDLPGEIAWTQEELIRKADECLDFDYEAYNEKYKRFYTEFCPIHDGKSTDKIITYIDKYLV